jgi:glutathione S-transferase
MSQTSIGFSTGDDRRQAARQRFQASRCTPQRPKEIRLRQPLASRLDWLPNRAPTTRQGDLEQCLADQPTRMESLNMKLYMHPVSTACRPVRLFAAENKIAMDEELVDLMTGAHLKPPYSTINPNSLVPMLEDGDLKLTECSAILKYLADKNGSPAYPKDFKARAKVNEVMDWINTNLYREFGYNLCYPQIFPQLKRRSDEAQAATLEIGQANAKRWLKVLNDYWLGPNKTYLCGNDISIADYLGSCIVTLGDIIGIDFSPYPNIKRWLDAMKKLPSWPKVNEVFDGFAQSVKGQKFVTLA